MAKKRRFVPANEVLDSALTEEKALTARLYLAMSGQMDWLPGEREKHSAMTKRVLAVIHRELSQDNAEWFSNLPESV